MLAEFGEKPRKLKRDMQLSYSAAWRSVRRAPTVPPDVGIIYPPLPLCIGLGQCLVVVSVLTVVLACILSLGKTL